MVQIFSTRKDDTKHKMGWLMPVALLLVVLGLGLILANARGRDDEAGAAGGSAVTSLPIGQSDKLLDLVDRRAELRDWRVQEVVGDKAFWAGPSPTQRVLVYLEERDTPGQAVEGGVDVRPGQRVDLNAVITKLPSMEQVQRQWDLTPGALEVLRREQVYLYVPDVTNLKVPGG